MRELVGGNVPEPGHERQPAPGADAASVTVMFRVKIKK
jgi:hypothetical protein